MKSLESIISKLSHNEVATFRSFLSSHCRNGRNKKLLLFDHLVNQAPESIASGGNGASRQSIYHVKKRLQEELYAFLITQEQVKVSNDRSFLEMECHKKLYCFKILFDKGIHDHAQQMLEDVLNIASKHSFHSLYLEAVNLKNIYFPLSRATVVRHVPVNREIKRLKKNLGRNLYVNQYLAEAGSFIHESDYFFRSRLKGRLTGFDPGETEPVIVELMGINDLFYQKDFHSARHKLMHLLDKEPDITADANISSLIYTDLAKACICVNELVEAQRLLAEPDRIKGDTFAHVVLELQFIITLRTGQANRLMALVEQSRKLRNIRDNPVLKTKWSFYELVACFQTKDFKKVIKGANADPIFSMRDKSWLINLKLLEFLSIYQLKDFDWLYYKIDSFRKAFAGTEWKQQRITHIVGLLKVQLGGKAISQKDLHEKISEIEKQFPWHPLSNELVNYCAYVEAMLTTEGQVSVPITA